MFDPKEYAYQMLAQYLVSDKKLQLRLKTDTQSQTNKQTDKPKHPVMINGYGDHKKFLEPLKYKGRY